MGQLVSIQNATLTDKTVLLRFDGDVPVVDGKVTDLYRLKALKETFDVCRRAGAKVVLLAHRGRPVLPKSNPALSTQVLVKPLEQLLGEAVFFHPDLPHYRLTDPVVLLENLRFSSGEIANSRSFAKSLALLGDMYCNDAFANSHRTHASMVALPDLLPHYAGLHLLAEVRALTPLLDQVDTPYVVILGGAKASDKFPILEKLVGKATTMLVGGLVAIPYLAAMGYKLGKHVVDPTEVKLASKHIRLMHAHGTRLCVPTDFISSKRKHKQIIDFGPDDEMLDVGPQTTAQFAHEIHKANTLFWNGAMGKFEDPAFAHSTIGIARAIGQSDADIRIASGGDTVSAIDGHKLAHNFTYISAGGGATLEFIAGEKLPGLEALIR